MERSWRSPILIDRSVLVCSYSRLPHQPARSNAEETSSSLTAPFRIYPSKQSDVVVSSLYISKL